MPASKVLARISHINGASGRQISESGCAATTFSDSRSDGRCLYEEVYCARGEMENRIKECQMDLFADRASTRVSGHISSFTSGPYLGVVLRD